CYVAGQSWCSKADAVALGAAHEQGNPENPQSDAMDLFNNRAGTELYSSKTSVCVQRCAQAAKDHKLYWFQRFAQSPPRRGLPDDYPGFTIFPDGKLLWGTIGTASSTPPPFTF